MADLDPDREPCRLEQCCLWTNENGLGGTDVKLEFNSPLFVQHFQSIADLAKDGTFRYGGRTSEAKQLFTSGECAILTESSGGLGDIIKSGMNYGIGQLPYYEGHGPQNTIPGGASLWVFAGKSDAEYKGIAQFFNFLSQTKIQVETAPGLRLHAGHHGGLRGHQEVRLLRQEPRPRNADPADDGQGPDRKLQGRAPGQPAAGSRHHERGIRSHAGRASRMQRRPSTRPSSAAMPPSAGRSAIDAPDAGFRPRPVCAAALSNFSVRCKENLPCNNVAFPNKILPYLPGRPQIILTVVFFFWPASQALYQSMVRQDPFGLKSSFVGLANFRHVLSDPNYLHALQVTVVFSLSHRRGLHGSGAAPWRPPPTRSCVAKASIARC
jgi:hypothetical protein